MDRSPETAEVDAADGGADTTIDATAPRWPDLAILGAFAVVGNRACEAVRPVATEPCAVHDGDWLADVYGVRVVRGAPPPPGSQTSLFRLVEAVEREGPVAIEAWVVDEQARPLVEGVEVVFCYPVAIDDAGEPSCGGTRVRVAPKAEGVAEFVINASAHVGCGEMGPIAVWVEAIGGASHSDRVAGLGMLVNTNHRHVNLLFQRMGVAGSAVSPVRCPLD